MMPFPDQSSTISPSPSDMEKKRQTTTATTYVEEYSMLLRKTISVFCRGGPTPPVMGLLDVREGGKEKTLLKREVEVRLRPWG